MIILLIGFAYVYHYPLPFGVNTALHGPASPLSPETKIFALIIMFLLATPIGLVINAFGWFFLNPFQLWLTRLWMWLPRKFSFPIVSTRRMADSEEVMTFFLLNSPSVQLGVGVKSQGQRFYELASYYMEVMRIYLPKTYEEFEHIIGVRRFIRSGAVICLFVSAYCLFEQGVREALFMFGVSVTLVVLGSMVEYHQCMLVFFSVFVMSPKHHSGEFDRDAVARDIVKARDNFGGDGSSALKSDRSKPPLSVSNE